MGVHWLVYLRMYLFDVLVILYIYIDCLGLEIDKIAYNNAVDIVEKNSLNQDIELRYQSNPQNVLLGNRSTY